MRTAIVLAIIIPAVFFSTASFLVEKDVPDPEFLSRDLFFQIDDSVISVPVVAVRDVTVPPEHVNPLPTYRTDPRFGGNAREFATKGFKAALLNLAADPNSPASVSSVKLNLGVYGTYGERSVSGEICPLLSQTWSQKACENSLLRKQKGLPITFRLSTKAGLEIYKRYKFSGVPNVRGSDLLEAMSPILSRAKFACADGQKFCSAAVLVSDNVYAVWSPPCARRTDEGCERAHIAEGIAITEFVQNELRMK